MNRYLQAVISGAKPTVEEWHEHLGQFHATFPDVTTQALAPLRAPGESDPYEYLADRLREVAPFVTSVLDVGCGDGSLLLALRERYGEATRLSGIDLSENEIERARERTPGADLQCGDVASARYPAWSFDLVVGHLSFALIPNLRSVFRTIHEALAPLGCLSFVIEDPHTDSTIFRALSAAMLPIRRRFPAFLPQVPEREACEDDGVLRVLLRDAGFTGDVHIERYALQALMTPQDLWEFARRSYPFGLLAPDLQEMAKSAVLDALAQEPDGRVTAVLPLRFVFAKR
jgi:SAM-dependent methyltransferase